MMRKAIKTNNGLVIRPYGNAKKVYENVKGEYYFNWFGKRFYTYNILRIMENAGKSGISYKENNQYHVICGYIEITNTIGLYVEFGENENGQYYIQFYEPVESEV